LDEHLNIDDEELRALFLEEAGDRVDRIAGLVASLETDSESRPQLLRELHALKGASRMMGLGKIAEICHRAEGLVEGPVADVRFDFELEVDRVRSLIEAMGSEERRASESSPKATSEPAEKADQTPRRTPRQAMRVESSVVDDLADRGARLRVISVAAGGLAERILRLATLAEHGVGDRDPRQVLATLATSLRQVALEFEGGQRILRRLTERQLEALLELQIQPLRQFLRVLAGHARELGASLGKKIEVKVSSGDALLDRRIVNALREAFLHLVRNAVDHGIECPAERIADGKPEVGRIRIEASSEGDRVRILVADDGRGVEVREIVRTAVASGALDQDEAADIDAAAVLRLLFRPGFTTRAEASEVSGRGIGLDAVATAVRSVGGDVWMESAPGEGTRVTVDVPVARRGDRVVVMSVGRHQLAVPASSIRAYRRITSSMVEVDNGRRVLNVNGQKVTAWFLSDLLGEHRFEVGVLVEMVVGGVVTAIVADAIVGEEEVIVRPLPSLAGAPDGVEGIALLANGRAVPVLSIQRLGHNDGSDPISILEIGQPVRPIHVLLVDDSRVTREMLKRLLEDAGFSVTGVSSAEDAIAALLKAEIDCLVTDIEMPEMDGLSLTRLLRDDQQHADLPIIVVSTLDRPADRIAGLEAGANAYLSKQGLDARELVALVNRVGGGA
jgi:two-component system chemotaxis sensor kinase CheA